MLSVWSTFATKRTLLRARDFGAMKLYVLLAALLLVPSCSAAAVLGFRRKPAQAKLAPGWREAKDAASGRSYYWNVQTRATTWVRPEAAQSDGLVTQYNDVDQVEGSCDDEPSRLSLAAAKSAVARVYCAPLRASQRVVSRLTTRRAADAKPARSRRRAIARTSPSGAPVKEKAGGPREIAKNAAYLCTLLGCAAWFI